MTRIGMSLLAAAVGLGAAWPAEAFWIARDWRGVAVGGIRAPLVAREAFAGRCWRCAPALAGPASASPASASPASASPASASPASASPALASPALAATAVAAGAGAAVAAAPTVSAATAAPAAPAPAAAPASKPAAPTQMAQANSASTHCAAGLPADSKMIYDASIRNMKSLETLRDTVVAETRSLVEAGRLSEADARPAAEKAGTCLRMLAHP